LDGSWDIGAGSYNGAIVAASQGQRLAARQTSASRTRDLVVLALQSSGTCRLCGRWLLSSDVSKIPEQDLLWASVTAVLRNNARIQGTGERAIVFAHGYGCDQNMWRYVEPAFRSGFRTVLYDQVGAGGSDLRAYDTEKYSRLDGYVDDLIELCGELGLHDAIFVGHSVSAMIGVLASLKAPGLFGKLILVGPSPRYIDDGEYVGGFSADQIQELLDFLGENQMGWAAAIAPAIMGNSDRPELGQELVDSFCRMDPEIAKQFAHVTFTSDNRDDLPKVDVPTVILQCSDDIIAPTCVGEYVHRHIAGSTLVQLAATGHCPNLSAPGEVIDVIRAHL
jgi:sigma-B regulation protein RsbQ